MGCGRDFWTIICILIALIGSTYLAVHNFSAAEFVVLLLLILLGFFSIISPSPCSKKIFFILVIVNTLYFLGAGIFSSIKALVFFVFVILGLILTMTGSKRCKPRYTYKVQAEPVKEVKEVAAVKKTRKVAKKKQVKRKAVKKKTTKKRVAKKKRTVKRKTTKKKVTKRKVTRRKPAKKRTTKRRTTRRKRK